MTDKEKQDKSPKTDNSSIKDDILITLMSKYCTLTELRYVEKVLCLHILYMAVVCWS